MIKPGGDLTIFLSSYSHTKVNITVVKFSVDKSGSNRV